MITYKVTVDNDGTTRWYNANGVIHREDGPAVEGADGYKAWYLNGLLHREDGPAVEYTDGSKFWYLNGKCHREDGPAVEYINGRKEWWVKGERHREDGPAIEYADGTKEWWLNDKYYSEANFNAEMLKHNSPCAGKVASVPLPELLACIVTSAYTDWDGECPPADVLSTVAYICSCFLHSSTNLGMAGVTTDDAFEGLQIDKSLPYEARLELATALVAAFS